MIKKIFTVMIIASLFICCFSGCYSMGRTTGEMVQKIEKGAEDFRKGYEDAEK